MNNFKEQSLWLVQSMLNNGDFVVETPNEGALVVAMEKAGYPLKPVKSVRNHQFDYDQFIEQRIMGSSLVEAFREHGDEIRKKQSCNKLTTKS